MKQRAVIIGRRADADIRRFGRYIAHFGAPATAERYVERLYKHIIGLDIATERGIRRGDIAPGLHIIAFERSATLAVLVEDKKAVVIRVFYRGQNWERALRHQFGKR